MDRSNPKARWLGGYRPSIEQLEERQVLDASTLNAALTAQLEEIAALKNGSLAKLDSSLIMLHQAAPDGNISAMSDELSASTFMISGENVGVQIAANDDLEALRTQLMDLGFVESNHVEKVVAGWISVANLDELAGLSEVRFVRIATNPYHTIQNQDGALATGALDAQNSFGVTGAGISVGVISDSYDALGGAAGDVAAGDLPGVGNPNGNLIPVTVLEDYLGFDATDEGRAMLQIVYGIAPDAALYFHTGFGPGVLGQSLAEAVTDLGNVAGMNVIVDDLTYFAEPMFQDGFVAQAVDEVAAKGIFYASSAGNNDRASYASAFREGTTFGGGTAHDFDPGSGVDIYQAVEVQEGAFLRFVLQWDQPYFSISPQSGGSQNDVDIYLLDAVTQQIVAYSVDINTGGDPYEILSFFNDGTYSSNTFEVVIVNYSGPMPGQIKYIAFGQGLTISEYNTASSTVYGHANAAGAVAVAAANVQQTPAFGQNPPLVEDFSSAGPTPILFDTAGNRLATPILRSRPQLTAPDGVMTSVPGFQPFFGTSAAAPQVAGLVALMKQASPTATNEQILLALEATAIDMDDPATVGFDYGYDFGTGFGLVNVDQAITLLLNVDTNTLIVMDVSQSMGAFYGDINLDGIISSLDDINGDGIAATVLDAAIAQVLKFELLLGPNVGLAIMGGTTSALDMSAAAGFQVFVNRNQDDDGNGVSNFHEVLSSLRIGTGGVYNTASVDPDRTYYKPALELIAQVAAATADTGADIYSDGAGLLPDPAVDDVLAAFPAGVTVNVGVIGTYQQLAPVTDLTNIAAATGGLVFRQVVPRPPEALAQQSSGSGTLNGTMDTSSVNTTETGYRYSVSGAERDDPVAYESSTQSGSQNTESSDDGDRYRNNGSSGDVELVLASLEQMDLEPTA